MAHQGKIANFRHFFDFSGPRKKWAQMAPNRARRIFFLLIQTLPTFWAERILILRIFIFWIFLDLKFPDFWVPDFQISSLGPGLGPDAAAGAAARILRSQPDPSPNAPRDQIRRKDPCCDFLVTSWTSCCRQLSSNCTSCSGRRSEGHANRCPGLPVHIFS